MRFKSARWIVALATAIADGFRPFQLLWEQWHSISFARALADIKSSHQKSRKQNCDVTMRPQFINPRFTFRHLLLTFLTFSKSQLNFLTMTHAGGRVIRIAACPQQRCPASSREIFPLQVAFANTGSLTFHGVRTTTGTRSPRFVDSAFNLARNGDNAAATLP